MLVEDDQHAFAELVRRHQSIVRATLRRLTGGDEALADDLAQETFVKAFRSLKHFRGEAKFSTWLYRIAYNVFLSATRTAARHEQQPANDDELTQEAEVGQIDLRHDLELAMRTLSERERTAITLCYTNGLTHEEAAGVLQCPLGTVKTDILRGKEKLRQLLAPWRNRKAT